MKTLKQLTTTTLKMNQNNLQNDCPLHKQPDAPQSGGITDETHDEVINRVTNEGYKYGFTTDVDTDIIPRGISEEVVRLISKKKGEPEWLL